MGRKQREEYNNAIYHVIQRGNNREFIFEDETDKNYLIGQINTLRRDMGYGIYGYVIMGNHYHLIIQINGESLKSIMHRINLRYSKFFNRKYGRTGHAFEARYKAISVMDDAYLLSLLRYIHQNPVKSGICKRVEEYSWSSDKFYRKNINDSVEIDFILDMFSVRRKIALQEYRRFMAIEEVGDFENAKAIGEPCITRKITTTYQREVRKGLDEILLSTGVNDKEFELIKNGSRTRSLTGYKLAYAREALAVNYTYKEIGKNINVSDAAIIDMLKRNQPIT